MRPVRLTMEGFAAFRNRTELDFTDADYFALVGPTGSGKSTVIDAITFALYGTVHRWRDAKAIANALAPTTNRGWVDLIFDSGGQRYRVTREVRRTTGKSAGVKTGNISLERFLDPTALPASALADPATVTATSTGTVTVSSTGVATSSPEESPQAENLLADSTDVRSLTPLVVEIVGLDLKDFNQCVVLPQGDFAQFLHASRPERQAILLKLLDVGHNERIRQAASSRAGAARTTAATLSGELATLGDGSEEAEKAATAARELLETLHRDLSEQVATFEVLLTDQVAAADQARHLTESLRTLQAIETPGNVAELSGRLTRTRAERDTRRHDATKASEDLSGATHAAGEGPDRARVQGLLTHRNRLDELATNRPGLQEAVNRSGQGRTLAEERVEATQQAAETAAATLAEATTRAREASASVERHQAVLGRLRVSAPAGLDQAVKALEAARATETESRADLAAAESRYATASARVSELTAAGLDPRTLDAARDKLTAAAGSLLALPPAAARTAAAAASMSSAEASFTSAYGSLEEAEAALEGARLVGTGASLRTTLQVGHDCPVCTQQVTTLPPPAPDAGQDAALRVRETARASLEGARTAREAAARQAATASRDHRGAIERASEAVAASLTAAPAALPELLTAPATGGASGLGADRGASTASEVAYARSYQALGSLSGLLTEVTTSYRTGDAAGTVNGPLDIPPDTLLDTLTVTDGATEAQRLADHLAAAAALSSAHHQGEADARTAAGAARTSAAAAAAALEAVRETQAEARTRLAEVAGALADLGAPTATTLVAQQNIAAAWATLDSWVTTTAEELRTGPLARAQESSATATVHLKDATAVHHDALVARRAAEADLREATVAADRAEGALARATTELGELTARLADEPDTDTLLGDLATADHLTEDVRAATLSARAATAAARAAEAAHEAVLAEAEVASAELRHARDSVSALRPPDLHTTAGADLADQWATLVDWATTTAEAVTAERDQHAAAARHLAVDLTARADQIGDLLTAQGLALRSGGGEVDANVARAASSVVALAMARAQSRVEEVLVIRTHTSRLEEQISQAQERAQVAGDLAGLLGTNKFSQWLADSVLDQLVATAADSLRTLSNGQFSLTHHGGDFFVKDHNDADQERSVRTLSGGETFQTSLALALALSEQLAELGTGGTGRLESIFLDEGFGTLDPEALDTVAVTLESLAQGNRMVGVVTHVPALAERIPTQFRVQRVNNTSTILTNNPEAP